MTDNYTDGQAVGGVGFWRRHRLLIIVAAIAIAAAAAAIAWLYVSKTTAVTRAEESVATQRAEWDKAAEGRQAELVKRSLGQFGVPLAWAIRREMMAGNLDQVDQYVSDLVKLEGFQGAMVAKADGVIAVASDRRHVGAAFDSVYAPRYLTATEINVEETAPGQWLLVVPVMGLSARLGTVAVEYRAPALTEPGA